ncbi:MAG: hypothetical protein KF723_03270 [Rhizobiaceae bacterium]|nr:hypothetical protein [Rhizobiaceae bacterium]
MDRLRPHEREFFGRWLASFADGDARLLLLLEASIGRIAAASLRETLVRRGPGRTAKMGDLSGLFGGPDDELVVRWLRAALDHGDDWLEDVDEAGVPQRLAQCESYGDLLDAANEDYEAGRWRLPGR